MGYEESDKIKNELDNKNNEIETLEHNLTQALEKIDQLREKEEEIKTDMPKLVKDIIDDLFKIKLSFKQEQEIKFKLQDYFELLDKKYGD